MMTNKEENVRYQKIVAAVLVLGLVLSLVIVSTARAERFANTTTLAAGVNAVWMDAVSDPGIEASGNAAMSLSPHLSLVGGLSTGLGSDSYLRSTVGVRVTATDVDNPDFSIGLGIQYRNTSDPDRGPSEWCPDVSVGLKPLSARLPSITLVGQGWYGLNSDVAGCLAGVRYNFHL
jgi:hypothetical protein